MWVTVCMAGESLDDSTDLSLMPLFSQINQILLFADTFTKRDFLTYVTVIQND